MSSVMEEDYTFIHEGHLERQQWNIGPDSLDQDAWDFLKWTGQALNY